MAQNSPSPGRRFHKDWRVWVAIGLMLAAMMAYVLTMDDSIQWGNPARSYIPTAR